MSTKAERERGALERVEELFVAHTSPRRKWKHVVAPCGYRWQWE